MFRGLVLEASHVAEVFYDDINSSVVSQNLVINVGITDICRFKPSINFSKTISSCKA